MRSLLTRACPKLALRSNQQAVLFNASHLQAFKDGEESAAAGEAHPARESRLDGRSREMRPADSASAALPPAAIGSVPATEADAVAIAAGQALLRDLEAERESAGRRREQRRGKKQRYFNKNMFVFYILWVHGVCLRT